MMQSVFFYRCYLCNVFISSESDGKPEETDDERDESTCYSEGTSVLQFRHVHGLFSTLTLYRSCHVCHKVIVLFD